MESDEDDDEDDDEDTPRNVALQLLDTISIKLPNSVTWFMSCPEMRYIDK